MTLLRSMRSHHVAAERASGGGYVLTMRGLDLKYFRGRREALVFAWRILIGGNPCR